MLEESLSLLLEPRSLVITTGRFYAQCLHGIDPVSEDVFGGGNGVKVANLDMLGGEETRDLARGGRTLMRETRYSLTCRDVAKVAGAGKLFGRR